MKVPPLFFWHFFVSCINSCHTHVDIRTNKKGAGTFACICVHMLLTGSSTRGRMNTVGAIKVHWTAHHSLFMLHQLPVLILIPQQTQTHVHTQRARICIAWLSPVSSEAVFNELEARCLPLTAAYEWLINQTALVFPTTHPRSLPLPKPALR